jgi:hypothetical protein
VTAGQRLALAGLSGRTAHAVPAATIDGGRAGFAGDAAEGQQATGGGGTLVEVDTELPATIGVSAAGLTGRPATGARHCALTGRAEAVATVCRRRAGGAGDGTGGRAADTVGTAKRATASRAGASLFIRQALNRVEADELARSGRIDAADERAAIGADLAGRPLVETGGQRLAGPRHAERRATIPTDGAGATVGRAIDQWERPRNRQLDVPPAGAGADDRAGGQCGEQRQTRCGAPSLQGRVPADASRRAVARWSPRGNSSR